MNLFKKNTPDRSRSVRDFPKTKTFSYRSARTVTDKIFQQNNQIEPKNKQTKSALSKVINIFIIATIFVCAYYISILDTNPVIKVDHQTLPRDESAYKQAIKKEMKGSIFNKNKLTFDSKKIKKVIQEEFPEVSDVSINIPLINHRPVVHVVLANPAARLVTGSGKYILDSEGRALFEQNLVSDQLNPDSLVTINDRSNHPVTLGKPVLTEQQISFVEEIISQAKAHNHPSETFNLEFGGSSVDVRYKDDNYLVKYNFFTDPKLSSGAYFALRKNINRGSVEKPAQYIDLRIPEKAFIK